MDCAAKFERDVAETPGVTRVELNFVASKLIVEGAVDPHQIIASGKPHNVGLQPDGQPQVTQPYWRANPYVIPTSVAALLAAAGWLIERAQPGPLVIALYALAILIGGYTNWRRGILNLVKREFDMNALMTVAVAGAAAIGEWGEGAAVAILFGVSETLSAYTMERARRSIRALLEIAPRTARIRRDGGEQVISVEEVRVGDTLLVRPGEKLAMDGQIIAGRSALDQAAITGESVPVDKGPGDEVFAGTLNGHGGLEARVTKLVADTTLAKLVHMVEEAQAQRAASQTLVERFARIYTPIVMALALLIIVLPPLLLAQPWEPWIYRGLALLVVACPCALIISTPVSIVAAISNAARNGVLIKGGAYLELAGTLRVIALDKTGTLTEGRPIVTRVQPVKGTAEGLLCLAAAVEERSEHPLARAIVEHAQCAHPHNAAEFQAIPGRGAHARVDGQEIFVGSPALFKEHLQVELGAVEALVDRWQSEGQTVMLVGSTTQVYGAIALADTPRSETAQAVAGLKRAGIARTVMLTGDNRATGAAIGRQIGVDEVRAELMPPDKVTAVRELTRTYGTVGMVGDGVNDAPALAAATVGIAMGGAGTDVALETADIVLMGDDLTKLPFTIALSRATLRVIKQNISLALGLKLLAVLAVFPGWLTLWLAILADMGATILVTLNGMRLLRKRPQI
jgi:Cd2+/Zn2+-exporting ATPase